MTHRELIYGKKNCSGGNLSIVHGRVSEFDNCMSFCMKYFLQPYCTNSIRKSKTFFPDVRVLNAKFYFHVIFRLHLERAAFKLKFLQKAKFIN